ncbi:alpha/beta-hydrolase [Salix suchowensis]|nr:alpha/beta-hydrolase [Salix suchowensis]
MLFSIASFQASYTLGLIATASHLAGAQTIDVGLQTGTFRGIRTTNGTEKWLGIPFAQPPLGNFRFKAPRPITTTSTAVRDALKFGNACPQVPSQSLGAPVGEDCLVLNLTTLGVNVTTEPSVLGPIWVRSSQEVMPINLALRDYFVQSAGAGSVEAHASISQTQSKNDPPPSTYDKPGKPFTRLLAATGCSIRAQ